MYRPFHPTRINGFGHPKGPEQVEKFDTTHQSRARASQGSSLQIQPNIYEVPLVSNSHLIDMEHSNLLTASVISYSKLIWKDGMALGQYLQSQVHYLSSKLVIWTDQSVKMPYMRLSLNCFLMRFRSGRSVSS